MKWILSALIALSVATIVRADEKPVLCTMRGTVVADPSAAPSVKLGKRTVTFCCNGCKGAFEKLDAAGKAKAVKITDLRVEKAVLQKKIEKLDAEIATLAAPAQTSQAGPAVVYCAVTDEEIGAPGKAAMTRMVNGKTYYLCCAGCAPKFDGDPAKFSALADERAAARAAK